MLTLKFQSAWAALIRTFQGFFTISLTKSSAIAMVELLAMSAFFPGSSH